MVDKVVMVVTTVTKVDKVDMEVRYGQQEELIIEVMEKIITT